MFENSSCVWHDTEPAFFAFQVLLLSTFFFEMEGSDFGEHCWVSRTRRGFSHSRNIRTSWKLARLLAVQSAARWEELTYLWEEESRLRAEWASWVWFFPRPENRVSLKVGLRRVSPSLDVDAERGDSCDRDLTRYQCFIRNSKLLSQCQWLLHTPLSLLISGYLLWLAGIFPQPDSWCGLVSIQENS